MGLLVGISVGILYVHQQDLGGGRHITSASMAENWPPLTSPGDLTQTEVPAASLQCAEVTDKRAWLSDDRRGSIE